MDTDTTEQIYVTVALNPDLVTELQTIVNSGEFVDLDVLVQTWLTDKLSEWLVSGMRGRNSDDSVESLVAEKERLMAWMANYVAAVQRSEAEMRNAMEQIERLKSMIPQRRASDRA